METWQKDAANRLHMLGASDTLVAHVTKVRRRDGSARHKVGANTTSAIEHFMRQYGELGGVTIDVKRFVAAVEVAQVYPDAAFRHLRETMIDRVAERGCL